MRDDVLAGSPIVYCVLSGFRVLSRFADISQNAKFLRGVLDDTWLEGYKTQTFELNDATLYASTAEGRLSGTEKEAWAYYTNGGRYIKDLEYHYSEWTRDVGVTP